ncbi:hypothetical protein N8K70_12780 [Microbacterium betulae]|uniref:Acyl-CoA dehydrogenase C-terminal domain-containing protein n=1 Tax=Microbacterium betulae TaxID=2981139 RepID=A0AA97FIP8_9MICO|nr:hypothetical protein [Microbacterium sp. AB]WOF22252.1 hypothetical protein N8K70_12780 [Microbacterium sp. AB]
MSASAPLPRPATLEEFDRALSGLLSEVGASAAQRERDRVLLHDDVAALQALGFGALRLPVAHGGLGVSFEQLVRRLVRIAAADSNLAHVYRGHIAFVEDLLARDAGDAHTITWFERIAAGDLVGNAQSERQETAEIATTLHRDGERLLLTGRKYYTTGSIYADWIVLSALDDGERVLVSVSAHDPGVTSVDDWDGFGQPLTGSGTTTFDAVPVDPAEIVVPGGDLAVDGHRAAVFQLVLLAVVAGIGQAALRDTLAFVVPRRRIFGSPGETRPRDDAVTQGVVGSVSSAVDAATRLVLSGAADVERAVARRRGGEEDALRDVLVDVFRLQQVVSPLVLSAATELFEVGGASAVSRGVALDRHWRNVRTIHSHNPAAQRRRAIGEFELNGTLPRWEPAGAARSAHDTAVREESPA